MMGVRSAIIEAKKLLGDTGSAWWLPKFSAGSVKWECAVGFRSPRDPLGNRYLFLPMGAGETFEEALAMLKPLSNRPSSTPS